MITEQEIELAVGKAIKKTINKFRENPYYFFTESDIHSYFYSCVYSSKLECTRNGKRIYLIHREYPTNFRFHKNDLLSPNCLEPIPLDKREGGRGHYDLAVLHPAFVQNASSCDDIVNKDVRLLEKRVKKQSRTYKRELLFAIEFKYIIKKSKQYIDSIKADNKKLQFSKMCGSKHAVNLVFCSIHDSEYIEEVKEVIMSAPRNIHVVFVQTYYQDNKKNIPKYIENKIKRPLYML